MCKFSSDGGLFFVGASFVLVFDLRPFIILVESLHLFICIHCLDHSQRVEPLWQKYTPLVEQQLEPSVAWPTFLEEWFAGCTWWCTFLYRKVVIHAGSDERGLVKIISDRSWYHRKKWGYTLLWSVNFEIMCRVDIRPCGQQWHNSRNRPVENSRHTPKFISSVSKTLRPDSQPKKRSGLFHCAPWEGIA